MAAEGVGSLEVAATTVVDDEPGVVFAFKLDAATADEMIVDVEVAVGIVEVRGAAIWPEADSTTFGKVDLACAEGPWPVDRAAAFGDVILVRVVDGDVAVGEPSCGRMVRDATVGQTLGATADGGGTVERGAFDGVRAIDSVTTGDRIVVYPCGLGPSWSAIGWFERGVGRFGRGGVGRARWKGRGCGGSGG